MQAGTQEGSRGRGLYRTLAVPPPLTSSAAARHDTFAHRHDAQHPSAKVLHTAARLLGGALTLLNSVVPPDATLVEGSPVAAATRLYMLRLLEAVQWLPDPTVLGAGVHAALVKRCASSVNAALSGGHPEASAEGNGSRAEGGGRKGGKGFPKMGSIGEARASGKRKRLRDAKEVSPAWRLPTNLLDTCDYN
jgi:hypothetical protein